MTRKDYQLIAQTINSLSWNGDLPLREYIAREFAAALATTNPNFDRERYLSACGLK